VQTIHRATGVSQRPMFRRYITQIVPRLEALNRAGCDIYFTVNLTGPYGRTAADIESIRAIFVEYDHGIPSEWPVEPTVTVLSSHGKLHAYWVLEPTNCPVVAAHGDRVRLWKNTQDRWVAGSGGDWNARDIARLLRLPGFVNHKYSPPWPVEIGWSNGRKYRLEDLAQHYQDVELPRSARIDEVRPTVSTLPDAEKVVHFKRYLAAAGTPPYTDRNPWYYHKACFGVRGLGMMPEEVAAVLTQHSEMSGHDKPYSFDTMLRLAHNAERYAKGSLDVNATHVRIEEDLE
jgi:hypothetical protein